MAAGISNGCGGPAQRVAVACYFGGPRAAPCTSCVPALLGGHADDGFAADQGGLAVGLCGLGLGNLDGRVHRRGVVPIDSGG